MAFPENKLKAMLKAGQVPVGMIIQESRNAGVVYVAAASGADFVMLDLEHMPQSYETAADLMAHARGAGLSTLVRISDLDYAHVQRIIDAGCQTILAPHLKSPDEVRRFIDLSLFYPLGMRGCGLYGHAASNYQQVTDLPGAMKWYNDQMCLGVMIETREAVEAAEDMLQPDIDFAIVGLNDLSQSYGIPGEFGHELMQSAWARVQDLCRERGIVYVAPGATGAAAVGNGLVFAGSELHILRDGLTRAVEAHRASHPK